MKVVVNINQYEKKTKYYKLSKFVKLNLTEMPNLPKTDLAFLYKKVNKNGKSTI